MRWDEMIWDEIGDSDYSIRYPTSYSTINLMSNHPDLEFFDGGIAELVLARTGERAAELP